MVPLGDVAGVPNRRSHHIGSQREFHLIQRSESEGHCIGIHTSRKDHVVAVVLGTFHPSFPGEGLLSTCR